MVERLRFARERPWPRPAWRRETAVVHQGGAAVMGRLGGWWPRLGAVIPVVALVVGLMAVSQWNQRERSRAAAEIDAVLLSDQLPPSAYADPGFVAFLKLAQP